MNARRVLGASILVVAALAARPEVAHGQCCLTDLFAGCGACFRKAPVYAVAPVAAPVVAPVAAPPPPVMVPVQQVSYVPETTYRTQYQNVPVTTYKPSCEIDPCTGCPVECMQPVTQYVQQAVNVPVTQYRAVTTTKYVQMQPPGYAAGGYAAPALPGMPAAAPAAPAASPFAAPAPVQTAPQGWGAAGADVPQLPGVTAPALPPATYPAPAVGQPTYTQPITPQAGYAPIQPAPVQPQPQPTQPPALAPAPSLKPIPELPRSTAPADAGTNGAAGAGAPAKPADPASPTAPAVPPASVPAVPGSATGSFPRLLDSGSHTTSWQPMTPGPVATAAAWRPAYPTAALPSRLAQ